MEINNLNYIKKKYKNKIFSKKINFLIKIIIKN